MGSAARHSPAPDVINHRNQIRGNRNGNFFCSHFVLDKNKMIKLTIEISTDIIIYSLKGHSAVKKNLERNIQPRVPALSIRPPAFAPPRTAHAAGGLGPRRCLGAV